MSSNPFPFGADTLAIPAFLVSDETDPAYLAWRAEHPSAVVCGSWSPAPRRPRPTPPNLSRPRPTGIDPAATVPTPDLIARSDLSTEEFMQIAANQTERVSGWSDKEQETDGTIVGDEIR